MRLDAYPDLLALRRLRPERYPCLLESVARGDGGEAAYDILFAFPEDRLVLEDLHSLERIHADGRRCPESEADFLAALDRWVAREPSAVDSEAVDLPFRGGWFLYLGYELAAQVEPGLVKAFSYPMSGPLATAIRTPAAVIRDHREHCCYLVAEPGRNGLTDAMRADIAEAAGRQSDVEADPGPELLINEDAEARYLGAVDRIHDYIRDGDVFQVNLSRQWTITGALPEDEALYARLRQTNPAPFAGFADLGGLCVISSSPERLVRVRDGRVETRPIAGTRPRGRDDHDDRRLAETLLAHPKERAEHIMLIDLERNDLGRVCQTGTVHVDELMTLESYRHVHHIVSNVSGRLRPGTSPGAVIRAVFPGGTITGCPKVRCMEIIAELEEAQRGAYTGSMGYLNLNGDMDLNILIRTLERGAETLRLRAGAGIVADSVPEKELAEARAKAKGLLAAVGVAV
ncbi:MAG: aminodeoxychorismate synthase component I [Gammaproteobacteria bacterium]|nr:aminodeoxychorismate synthase component I [Gammaproteobacteria bacterium]